MSLVHEWRRDARRILLDVVLLRPHPSTDMTSVAVAALVDTGATASGISRALADELQLPSIGKQPIGTAGGTTMAERFLFRIGIPREQQFPFIFDDITGFELGGSEKFQALLRMDVLSRCDFTMLRDGRCRLAC